MSKDQDDGKIGEVPRAKQGLPSDLIEEVKRTILFGVGYKRPPESGRFRKGQSGNPKGRPKNSDLGIGSSRSTNALVLKEAERLIMIREGEEAADAGN